MCYGLFRNLVWSPKIEILKLVPGEKSGQKFHYNLADRMVMVLKPEIDDYTLKSQKSCVDSEICQNLGLSKGLKAKFNFLGW